VNDGVQNKYADLDAAIVARIRAGAKRFHQINIEEVRLIAGQATPNEMRDPYRVIDRRLQHLQHKHVIQYSRSHGWAVLTPKDKRD
jgi:hypothetical protein